MNNQEDDLRIEKINIKEVFYSKNARLARLLPGFFFNYLERIIHQDFINDFLSNHGDKIGVDFAEASIKEFNITSEVIGEERIPKAGRFIFASNHPLGGFDALLLLSWINKYFNEVKFLVNDILMNLKNLRPLFIPINKHGGQSRKSVDLINDTYISNKQIITFPAGLVSRKRKGIITDPAWHKSFIQKAIKYKRDIIPIHVSGRNTNFFYNLANLRKFLGIRANIEMLYLVDETYKHRNKHIKIHFGEPIPFHTFDKSRKPEEWAQFVKSKVYEMGGISI